MDRICLPKSKTNIACLQKQQRIFIFSFKLQQIWECVNIYSIQSLARQLMICSMK